MPDLKLIRVSQSTPPKADVETRVTSNLVQPRVELDIKLKSDGTFDEGPIFLEGIDRSIQDVVKGILTTKGTNYMAPNYGTSINNLIHASKLGDVSGRITSEIQTLLGYLAKFTLDEDETERIEELVSLKAKENVDTIELELTIRTGGGETASILV